MLIFTTMLGDSLHRLDVGSISHISEAHVDSVFKVTKTESECISENWPALPITTLGMDVRAEK
jgi:hypothetical protein